MKKSILMLLFVPMLAFGQIHSNNPLIASSKNHVSYDKSIALEKPKEVHALSKYTGHYKSELVEDFEIDLFIEEGKLYGQRKGESEKVEISPVSPSKFVVKGPQVQIQFMEKEGEVDFMMVAKDEMTWLVKVK